MRTLQLFPYIPARRPGPGPAAPGGKPGRPGVGLRILLACIMTAAILAGGCSPLSGGSPARIDFEEADALFKQGSHQAALARYGQIIETYPAAGDRALFEMGIIHAHPQNPGKDYEKALACFQKLAGDYPGSGYRHDSDMMLFYISNVIVKDEALAAKQAQIDALRQTLTARDGEIGALQQQIEMLERKVFAFARQAGPVDRILIEKQARTLKLISGGEVIKTYRVALGGDPNGPKERQGDNKTPEGIYFIDARNQDSSYHLALHVSYPNEKDRQRARELGVATGGDIMIHGIKNGFSWVGNAHADVDWTRGCIAVTDEEIEEIDQLAPIGTAVEIRP